MTPKISLIIPIYNVEKYLRECLQSVVMQTFKDIEIILVDDLGSDDSMEVACEFAAKDKRIKIVTRKKNGGLSAARNTGIKNSSAPFIMFCDSDDFVAPTFCEKLLYAIESSGAEIAMCGTNIIYEIDEKMIDSDKDYYKIKFDGLVPMSDDVLWKSDVSMCNKIYHRGILEKHDIEFPENLNYEDAYFFNAYACWVKNIYFVNEPLYTYRRRRDSIMNQTFSNKPGYSIDHLKIGIILYEYLKKHNLFMEHKDYMGKLFFSYCYFALRYESTSIGKDNIYKLGQDFVRREKWRAVSFSQNIRRKICMLANKTLLGETHGNR
jgi:glycosyltransferase involved in cell wall biosynthesis